MPANGQKSNVDLDLSAHDIVMQSTAFDEEVIAHILRQTTNQSVSNCAVRRLVTVTPSFSNVDIPYMV